MPEIPPQPLAENLHRSRTVAEFNRAEGESLRAFDALNEQIIGQNRVNLACRAGCSLCCSLRVDVLAHEVFLLAHHVLTTFPSAEITALAERLEAHEDKVLRLTPFEHATTNIRCAMLRNDGCCGVYAARPRSCRRHHSQDLAACQYTFDHPTDLETPAAHDRDLYRTLSEAMQQGIDAYAQLGFDLTVYELGTALAEALRDPSCWGRWRHGGAAFLYASVTPSG